MGESENKTPEALAEMLLKVLPVLGRRLGRRIHETGEEDTMPLMQVMALTQIRNALTTDDVAKLRSKHGLTTSDLAKMRRVSLQTMSVMVQNLVERGWVVRAPDPNDRRQMLLEVTPEGQARAQAANALLIGYMAGLLDGLTPEQVAAGQVFLPALMQLLNDSKTEEGEGAPFAREESIRDTLS